MRIKEVEFGFLKNIGNYENSRVSYRAELEDWENPEDCINLLRNRAAEELDLPDRYRDLRAKIKERTDALNALNADIEIKTTQLHRAEQAWDNFAEFLVGHGVDPEKLTLENFTITRIKNEYHPPVTREVAAIDTSGNYDDNDHTYGEDNDEY